MLVTYEGPGATESGRSTLRRLMDDAQVGYVAGGPGWPDIDVGKLDEPGWEHHTYHRWRPDGVLRVGGRMTPEQEEELRARFAAGQLYQVTDLGGGGGR